MCDSSGGSQEWIAAALFGKTSNESPGCTIYSRSFLFQVLLAANSRQVLRTSSRKNVTNLTVVKLLNNNNSFRSTDLLGNNLVLRRRIDK